MAEYWKSQPKHYCKFCDCWIADNKPSKDYHEKGKKHQQNVQAKISAIHKKSRDDAKKKAETNSYMKEMEKKALAAAKKDLERDPSLAALYGVTVQEKVTPQYGPANRPVVNPPRQTKRTQRPTQATSAAATAAIETTAIDGTKEQSESTEDNTDYNAPEFWDEDISPEGYTYYWNTVTSESRWVPPEGYIPRSERNPNPPNPEDTDKTDDLESTEKETDGESAERSEEETDEARGTKRKLEDEEEVKEDVDCSTPASSDLSSIPLPGAVTDPSPETSAQSEAQPTPVPEPVVSRQPKHSAYSAWETSKEPKPEPQVDLQLPETTFVEEKMLTVYEEPKMKFREKTVSSLSRDNLPAVFRKKKKGIGYKNLKARTDDL